MAATPARCGALARDVAEKMNAPALGIYRARLFPFAALIEPSLTLIKIFMFIL